MAISEFRENSWKKLEKLMTLSHYASLEGSTVREIDYPWGQGRSSIWLPVIFRWKIQLHLGHVIFISTYENIYRQLVFIFKNLPSTDHCAFDVISSCVNGILVNVVKATPGRNLQLDEPCRTQATRTTMNCRTFKWTLMFCLELVIVVL